MASFVTTRITDRERTYSGSRNFLEFCSGTVLCIEEFETGTVHSRTVRKSVSAPCEIIAAFKATMERKHPYGFNKRGEYVLSFDENSKTKARLAWHANRCAMQARAVAAIGVEVLGGEKACDLAYIRCKEAVHSYQHLQKIIPTKKWCWDSELDYLVITIIKCSQSIPFKGRKEVDDKIRLLRQGTLVLKLFLDSRKKEIADQKLLKVIETVKTIGPLIYLE